MSANPEKTAFLKDIRSIRTYKDTPIDEEVLKDLVDAARMAPTARNIQPWEFVVITDREVLTQLAEVHINGRFLKDAPAAIVVLCRRETDYFIEDGSAATQNIIVAARLYDLKSCWIGGCKGPYYENDDIAMCEGVPCKIPPMYDDLCSKLKEIVKAPIEMELISIVSLGYSDEHFVAEKRELEEVLHWNHFNQ
ncbi:nitroreductase family protein [Anoxynatronum buryatiense]|uniref:Nitroreductase n=1 Tax=Anoxynatronum buryatiense TaxID=489973 RepID=A0AA45WU34_9CLOT|nr:nitroreductase family protein [Anoxynatronum buryatiense]SMP41420.1 Nitroreductase [Anoxynatronum buryatiense]